MFRQKSTKELVQGGSTPKPSKPPKEPRATKIKASKPEADTEQPVKKEPGALFRKSKFLIAALCILLAAVIAFVGLPKIYKDQAALTSAVLIKNDIDAGTVITKDMLSVEQIGAYGLPEHVLRSVDDAIGMVAAEKLYAGELLWNGRIMSEDAYNALSENDVRPVTTGHCLVTIELPSASAGVAGVLRSGDTVDIFRYAEAYDDETGEESLSVEQCLSRILVYDVLNDKLISLDTLDKELIEDTSGTTKDYKPAYVVFDCTKDQAVTLIALEQEGTLHMTRPAGG